MPRSQVDVGKLVKMLMLTQSSNDQEALGAIRAANAHLKAAGFDWNGLVAEFMSSPGGPAPEDSRRTDPRRAAARKQMFDTLDDAEAVADRLRRLFTRFGGR